MSKGSNWFIEIAARCQFALVVTKFATLDHQLPAFVHFMMFVGSGITRQASIAIRLGSTAGLLIAAIILNRCSWAQQAEEFVLCL